MTDPFAVTRARELTGRYLDGNLGPEEFAELQSLLCAHPAAADAFARATRLDGGLRDLFAQERDVRREAGLIEAIGRRQWRRRWLARAARLAAAACVLFAALAALLAWLAPHAAPLRHGN